MSKTTKIAESKHKAMKWRNKQMKYDVDIKGKLIHKFQKEKNSFLRNIKNNFIVDKLNEPN